MAKEVAKKDAGKQLPMARDFRALGEDVGAKAQTLALNLGNRQLGLAILDRITVPPGGGVSWEVPTLTGPKAVEAIEGIVIHKTDGRVFWKLGLDESGGNAPPDCYSTDLRIGIGDPGGDCLACPYSQFGSARDGTGKGQACKEQTLLFMLQKDKLSPILVSVPPTSSMPLQKFFLRMADSNLAYFKAVIALRLEKAKNAANITYSRMVPQMIEPLDEEMQGRVEIYRRTMLKALSGRGPIENEE